MHTNEYDNIKINVGMETLSYYMTNDAVKLFKKVFDNQGYAPYQCNDFIENDALAESVRREMQRYDCIYSLTYSNGYFIINYYDGGTPMVSINRFFGEAAGNFGREFDYMWGN